jgi:hypothetical protein
MKKTVSSRARAFVGTTLLLMVAFAAHAQPRQAVETLEHVYGPFSLKPGALQQVPPIMEIRFPEDLWLVGYRTRMVDEAGKPLSREFQCHTFFGTSMPQHHTNDDVIGLFSDGYTEAIDLPEGFGIFFRAGEKILWNPMFNNRNTEQGRAAMKLSLNVIRAKNLEAPLRLLRTTFRTIREPSDLYFVTPGKDVRDTTFELPSGGTIHVIGTHIHPYGVSIELFNVSRNEPVWAGIGSRDSSGRLMQMPLFRSVEGYQFRKGERFRMRAVYENPTAGNIDAMAGVFILYAPAN